MTTWVTGIILLLLVFLFFLISLVMFQGATQSLKGCSPFFKDGSKLFHKYLSFTPILWYSTCNESLHTEELLNTENAEFPMKKSYSGTEKEPQKIPTSITEKEESPSLVQKRINENGISTLEELPEHLLKLAALLKKWKWQKKKFWMRIIFSLFILAYAVVLGVPLGFIWLGEPLLREGLEINGKWFISAALLLMFAVAVFVSCVDYKRWERQHTNE